ncbi:MAG: hypothetical protein EOR30_16955 [Mesorhizobium sp.]|uniref:hypothetical protein n=1 Tax=unclassified Mesorhizobium TaxID=325217 RepID=UPI000FCC12D6|nr:MULTISPECIES: hypothetical protein [unclassified Mesorhizobium]RUV75944.1 hypothetical protein EOA78_04900 [Mesorhizobium sp. M5C.F.Cr.IN.023.01.1.1]RWF85770.1 MAG: hypothetical protein EOQ36_20910 [Mesorhizobium sp.]RWF95268.1 MAG: hypothetical protein EOQ45_08020 [Mesorhizobium sp.]RWI39899.1 MAG: hypothetical protein EOR14_17630 [Mesorhizobium sp.]RWI45237.1 MAG: hypothetical protein EOR15_22410 [Mesorhizobium sp.]
MRNEHGLDEHGLVDGEVEIWRNSSWRVTSLNLDEMSGSRPMGSPYSIALSDLGNPMWPEHMCAKVWVNRPKFIEAYRKACEVAGVTPNETGIERVNAPGFDQ